jgi:hypothetical protein
MGRPTLDGSHLDLVVGKDAVFEEQDTRTTERRSGVCTFVVPLPTPAAALWVRAVGTPRERFCEMGEAWLASLASPPSVG